MLPMKLFAGIALVAAVAGGILYIYNTGKDAGYSKAVSEFTSTTQAADTLFSRARSKLVQEQRLKFEAAIKKSNEEAMFHLVALKQQEDINDSLRETLIKPKEVQELYQECKFSDEDHNSMIDLYSILDGDTEDERPEERMGEESQ